MDSSDKTKQSNQKGFSLIEILVTMIILAVGLLGLASLQAMSLKNVNNTQFRTLATIYAYDMAERMRSNKQGVTGGNYDSVDGDESDPSCTGCSVSAMAQLDAFEWNTMIKQNANAGGLPSGVGTVTKNGSLYDIKVTWTEQGRDSSGGTVSSNDFILSIRI